MYSIFIDTHSNDVLVALYKDGKVINFKVTPSEKDHCTNSIITIEAVLRDANISVKQINEVIVVNGPGSFTGVRIGVTIAKTLAFSLRVPIKVINSLAMFALSNNKGNGKLIALADSKGYYFCMFNQLNLPMWDYDYLPFDEFNKLVEAKHAERMVLKDGLKIDLDELYIYIDEHSSVSPHEVNPIYIKSIEVEND